jgi:CRISPR system Cascade subunit CasE
MYLSRLILNPRSRTVQRDLADCHELHRSVMSGFPDVLATGDARARLGVLYRADVDSRKGGISLLVQSEEMPDWSRLPGDYLLTGGRYRENPACKPIDAAYERIERGNTFAFRLRANPTKRISTAATAEQPRGGSKRVDLRSEHDQLAWLARKGEQGGFELLTVKANPHAPEVPNARVLPVGRTTGYRERGTRERGQRMTFGSVLFEGLLRVTDVEQFRATLAGGIGSGKAYGFGLLTIAPPRALEE